MIYGRNTAGARNTPTQTSELLFLSPLLSLSHLAVRKIDGNKNTAVLLETFPQPYPQANVIEIHERGLEYGNDICALH